MGSALEQRCRVVDDMIMNAVESGDMQMVLRAMGLGDSVLSAESFLRVVTPCLSSEDESEDDSPSDEVDQGFLPVYIGPSPPEWSHSPLDVVNPVESGSEDGYVSGSSVSTDSTVWVLES